MIRLNFIGELKYDRAMREHHSGLHSGRRNLRIVVAVLAALIAFTALTGRTAVASGVGIQLGWILLILLVVESVYIWVARRMPDDLVEAPTPPSERR